MIGLSTTYYATQGLSIHDSVLRIVELGFDVVEFGPAHIFEEDIWKILNEVKRDFPKVNFTVHTLFPPLKDKIWFNPSDGLTRVNKEIVDNLFQSAIILNALLISIHPPVLNEVSLGSKIEGNFDEPLIGKHKNKSSSSRNFIIFMDYVNKKAEQCGIKILIENMDENLMRTILSTKYDFMKIF
ncbi:hypothetical protein KJ997_02680, partial [bacterium]|nr:hypothetical protein [bacterium]